ncbi:YchJ family metal-binding protein [Gallaecimonas sp. GXIMD4217]|uniref:YchJ family protein n=1 Tax=Gallaecimonas sp. GXIMD4217 TaxID=3131927 RepID=UPI00311AD740
MAFCYCGSTQPFSQCCQAVIGDQAKAATAEQLMRARYSAHCSGDIDFILASWHPDGRHQQDVAAIAAFARDHQWLGLEVLSQQRLGDDEARVTFVARFRDQDGQGQFHLEDSRFLRQQGLWYYHSGLYPEPQRNGPCPCGSGKKYKRCCD